MWNVSSNEETWSTSSNFFANAVSDLNILKIHTYLFVVIVNYMTKILVFEKQKMYDEAWNLVSNKPILTKSIKWFITWIWTKPAKIVILLLRLSK